MILDDPSSVVDVYVGKYILDHCLLDAPLANRIRILGFLVTCSLHILDKVDYIFVMDNGTIFELGTYIFSKNWVALMKPLFLLIKYWSLMSDGPVSCLMDEYGNAESRKDNRKERIAGLAKKKESSLSNMKQTVTKMY